MKIKQYIYLITALLTLFVSGCNLSLEKQQARLNQYSSFCTKIGFKDKSQEHSKCVFELEKAYLSNVNQPQDRYTNDNPHIQRQIMIHGAGGCTPNYSTGGCL